jgi:hypothetical protein
VLLPVLLRLRFSSGLPPEERAGKAEALGLAPSVREAVEEPLNVGKKDTVPLAVVLVVTKGLEPCVREEVKEPVSVCEGEGVRVPVPLPVE